MHMSSKILWTSQPSHLAPRAAEQIHVALDPLAELPLKAIADKGASGRRERHTLVWLVRWEEGQYTSNDATENNLPRVTSLPPPVQ